MYGSYSLQTCRPIENIASGDTPRIKGKRNKRKKSKNNTEIVLSNCGKTGDFVRNRMLGGQEPT